MANKLSELVPRVKACERAYRVILVELMFEHIGHLFTTIFITLRNKTVQRQNTKNNALITSC